MLEVSSLTSGYGDARAVEEISLSVERGGVLALLGRNGAGKTTTLKTIMGLLPLWSGSIELEGRSLSGLGSDQIARAGLGYVPEDRRIFTTLSVLENLETGRKSISSDTRQWSPDRLFELFPEIARRKDAGAGTLSGGERQMLAIARALMGSPKLLLLDEPSEGLAPVVVQRLANALSELPRDGVSMLISEQNRKLVEKVAEDVIILESGIQQYSGTFADLRANPAIAEQYLGI